MCNKGATLVVGATWCMYTVCDSDYALHFRCCRAAEATVPTCTNPLTQTRETNSADLCPTPPQVSLTDVASGAQGRVESDTVFLNEALLRKATDMDPEVYIRRIQAGFLVSYRDPPYSGCGCSDPGFFEREYVGSLAECRRVQGAEMYALRDDSPLATPLTWLSDECLQFDGSGSGSGSEAGNRTEYLFNGTYLVDGASANLLQNSACQVDSTDEPVGCMSESFDNRPVGKYYPDQTRQITATVFYNNNVCTCMCLYNVQLYIHVPVYLVSADMLHFSSHGICQGQL